MAGGSGGVAGLNPTLIRAMVVMLGLGLAGYIVGPPLYWHVVEALDGSSGCPPCTCDCSSQPLLSIPEDCAKRDSEVSEEMDKSFTDVLAEELKLREVEATTAQRKADVTLLEAKKLSSQYQKEADKCSSGMNTCEEAREKAEAALTQQKRLSALWESRARQQGWKPGNARSA
ncbi:hypothetical protein FCM35_KLT13829 [Carex littledalei]|uniref:Uncharacterized protein n=1 Tax=Carex littledalei TaxID=544730 RepID=A0A833VFK2_9POAL|nr:hypothetical protein FCM35_KLT13829 [Carex littledalei]